MNLEKSRFVRLLLTLGTALLMLAGCTSGSATDERAGVPSTLAETTPADTTSSADPPSPFRHVDSGAGDGGDGSEGRPYSSLATALQSLVAGQTLIVRGGTYVEQIDLKDPSVGTASEPIVVQAAEGERPIVQGLLWMSDLEHWRIEGINVTWDDEENSGDQHMVKIDGGNDWVFADAEIWGARSYAAVLVSGLPRNYELSGLYVHDTAATNDTNQDHLIYLNSGTHGGIVERNLLVGSPNGRAIKVGPEAPDGDWVGNIVIRFNTMVDNLGPSNVQLGWRTADITIENNLMVGALEDRANITTFELSGGGNVVRNNVGWDSAGVLEDDVNLEDGGGNILEDPMFADDDRYEPTNTEVVEFGYLVGGS